MSFLTIRRSVGSIAWPKRPNDGSSHMSYSVPPKNTPRVGEQQPLALECPTTRARQKEITYYDIIIDSLSSASSVRMPLNGSPRREPLHFLLTRYENGLEGSHE